MHAILFTDLESSTRLREQHPEEMKGALATHDAIPRRAVEAAEGHVLKTMGDGVIAVFSEVADGLACIVGALALARWFPELPDNKSARRLTPSAATTNVRRGQDGQMTLLAASKMLAAATAATALLSLPSASLPRPDHRQRSWTQH